MSSRQEFCATLEVDHPIVCPPMAANAGGRLAAAVSKAGGVGLIGAGHVGLDNLKKEVEEGRKAFGLNQDDPLPFGVGLVLWKLETPFLSPSEASSISSSFLSYIASIAPHSLWLSFSPQLERWVERYREVEEKEGKGKKDGRKTFIFVMPSKTEEIIEARNWRGVDVVVAQGTEAGGHGPNFETGLPLDKLLPHVTPHYSPRSRPFLLAAGGISSPSTVKRVLDDERVAGCVCGTAFTVATESLWTTVQKELVCRTRNGEEDTARGMEWDRVRNALGWPQGVDGRAIKNRTSGLEKSVREDEERKLEEGEIDLDMVGTWAGTGVGEVKSIKPAAEILQDLVSQLD